MFSLKTTKKAKFVGEYCLDCLRLSVAHCARFELLREIQYIFNKCAHD